MHAQLERVTMAVSGLALAYSFLCCVLIASGVVSNMAIP